MVCILSMLIITPTLSSCSNQGVYSGLNKRQQILCNRVPESEYEACMEEADMSYEDYKKTREEIIEK